MTRPALRIVRGRAARAALAAAVAAAAARSAAAAPGVQLADLSSVILSLALVIGFIFAAAYVVRRTPFGMSGKRNGSLQVVAALPLGPKERLLLVQARDQELLIAVSPAGVFNVGAPGAAGNLPVGPRVEEPKFKLPDAP
jgi:flagellar protein FliO/FliZ